MNFKNAEELYQYTKSLCEGYPKYYIAGKQVTKEQWMPAIRKELDMIKWIKNKFDKVKKGTIKHQLKDLNKKHDEAHNTIKKLQKELENKGTKIY